jgi:hypothetical protein
MSGDQRFDAMSVSSCAGANGRVWLRYPNNFAAATERQAANGPPNGDSLRAVIAGFAGNAHRSGATKPAPLPHPGPGIRGPELLYRDGIPDEAASVTRARVPGAPLLPRPTRSIHTTIRLASRVARCNPGLRRGRLARPHPRRSLLRGRGTRVSWDGRDAQGRETGGGAYFVSLEADGTRAPRGRSSSCAEARSGVPSGTADILRGGVKVPTGGRAREPGIMSRGRSGVIPEPTVTVWMGEGRRT